MVVFLEIFYFPACYVQDRPNPTVHIRRLYSWGNRDVDSLFPRHQMILSEFRPVGPPYHHHLFWATMYYFRGGRDRSPDIISRFISRYCRRCGCLHRHFTVHGVRLPTGGFHWMCVSNISPEQSSNSHAQADDLSFVNHRWYGVDDPQSPMWGIHFLSKSCPLDRRERHLYAIWATLQDRYGQLGVHCFDDNLCSGILVAACYRYRVRRSQRRQNHRAADTRNADHRSGTLIGNAGQVDDGHGNAVENATRVLMLVFAVTIAVAVAVIRYWAWI